MAAYNKFNTFVGDIGLGVHNLNTDVLKIALSDVAPIAANSVFASITEIAAGNGYVAGGNQVGSNAYSQTNGLAKLTGNNVVFTGSGSPMAPFRYIVLYNSTPAAGPLIGWWDNGSEVILSPGDSFTVMFDAVNGILNFI